MKSRSYQGLFSEITELNFAIKVNASNERRFDRSTVIFKFGVRIKLHV